MVGARPGRAMGKRFALAAVLIVVLTAGASATAALLKVSSIASNLFKSENHLSLGSEITAAEAGAPQTIMVIGSDKRPQAKSIDAKSPPHSDTMMLVRMDPSAGQTSVLSIPRDLKVTIQGPRGPTVEKINAAYTLGGSTLALRTVERLLHVQVNHLVDVNFQGFRRAVDAVGCVYADVDRRYFNPVGTGYASINIQPGYQRLCGQTALDYVRFRHTDSDFVRVARQQDFMRQFKAQVGLQGVLDHETQLEHAVNRSIQTDIHGTRQTLTLLKLTAFSTSRPVRQVHFQSTAGPSYVTATPYDIRQTVHDFLTPGAHTKQPASQRPKRLPGRRSRHRRRVPSGHAGLGLAAVPRSELDKVLTASVGLGFPALSPRRALASGGLQMVRRYGLNDTHRRWHRAYRIVFSRGLVGEYYGLEGTDWRDPPILAKPDRRVTRHGRTYLEVVDGDHLHVVGWRTANAIYWVTNTLLEGLSNAQMLAIADSASAVQ